MDVREAFTGQREAMPDRLAQLQEWVKEWRMGDPTGLSYRGEVAPEPEPLIKGNLQPTSKE